MKWTVEGTECDQMYTLYTCIEVFYYYKYYFYKIKVLHFFQKKMILLFFKSSITVIESKPSALCLNH